MAEDLYRHNNRHVSRVKFYKPIRKPRILVHNLTAITLRTCPDSIGVAGSSSCDDDVAFGRGLHRSKAARVFPTGTGFS